MDKYRGLQGLLALPEPLCKPAFPHYTSSHCKIKIIATQAFPQEDELYHLLKCIFWRKYIESVKFILISLHTHQKLTTQIIFNTSVCAKYFLSITLQTHPSFSNGI